MIAVCWVLFGWSALTAEGGSDGNAFESGIFSGSMVLVVFIQISIVVVDRVCFLYRSLIGKLLLQYFTVFLFHSFIFLVWPAHRTKGFRSNAVLVMFYALKSIYFWLSALQIRHGYPAYQRHHRALVNRASKVRVLLFKGFRAIPFVAELDILCDWMTTDTALE